MTNDHGRTVHITDASFSVEEGSTYALVMFNEGGEVDVVVTDRDPHGETITATFTLVPSELWQLQGWLRRLTIPPEGGSA